MPILSNCIWAFSLTTFWKVPFKSRTSTPFQNLIPSANAAYFPSLCPPSSEVLKFPGSQSVPLYTWFGSLRRWFWYHKLHGYCAMHRIWLVLDSVDFVCNLSQANVPACDFNAVHVCEGVATCSQSKGACAMASAPSRSKS